MSDITTIDAYIAQAPAEVQERLHQLRQIIQEAAPDAKEKMSWAMPTYTYHGNLIHFAVHKKHLGIYPGPEAIIAFQKELEPYVCSKGAIQLPYALPLPKALIRNIVTYCVEERKKEQK